jgi:hypothetical protein
MSLLALLFVGMKTRVIVDQSRVLWQALGLQLVWEVSISCAIGIWKDLMSLSLLASPETVLQVCY